MKNIFSAVWPCLKRSFAPVALLVPALLLLTAEEARATGACTCARLNDWKDCGCHKTPAVAGGPASGASEGGGNQANCPTCPPPRGPSLTGPDSTDISTGALGMPRWWVNEPYINLHVVDEPMSYTTSCGQDMVFRMTYKQNYTLPTIDQIPNFWPPYLDISRDEDMWVFPYMHAMQSFAGPAALGGLYGATNGMTNASWMHNWQGCIVLWDSNWETHKYYEDPPPAYPPFYSDGYEALAFLPDGGVQYFTYDQDNQYVNAPTQLADPVSQAQLQSFPGLTPAPFYPGTNDSSGLFWGAVDGEGTPTNGLKLVYPDGSVDIFGLTFWNGHGNTPYTLDTTACALLTERIDPQGRSTRLAYARNNFTNSCTGIAYYVYRLAEVVDTDGNSTVFTYSTNSVMPSQLQEVEGPFGRKVTFDYNGCGGAQQGWLTGVTDAASNTSTFAYQSGNSGWMSSLITPYGTNGFHYYQQAGDSDITNSFTVRAIYVTEPEGADQLFAYVHNTSGKVESNATPPTVSGCVFDDGSNGGLDDALYHRNSFYWDRRQTPNLSTHGLLASSLGSAISGLTSNDFCKGRMQHWLLDADGISITETLSSERDPSPDPGGTIEGQRTWYSYGNSTPADQYTSGGISSDIIAAMGQVLPDGTSQYIQYSHGYSPAPWIVTESAQSYTQPDGTIGTFANYFTYSTNYVDLLGVSNSLRQFVHIGYNASHQPTAMTNALNQVKTYSYAAGTLNLASITNYSGQSVNYYYGEDAYVSQVTLQPQNWTWEVPSAFGFDGYCDSNFNCFCLPLVVEISGTGFPSLWVTNTWDGLNRLTGVTFPDGTTTSNIYTRLDLTARKDRLNRWTYYDYDGLQHLVAVTDALGNVTSYTWCACGSLTSVTDALTNTTYLNRNNQGMLTNVEYPDGSSMNWQFDLPGRMTNQFDGAGHSSQFTYNNQNQIVAISNVYGQLFGAYFDAAGRPVLATNANGVAVSNAYDLLNRVTNETWLAAGSSNAFGWSSNGLVAFTNQDHQWTLYGRDAAGRLMAVTNAVQTNTFSYNGLNELAALTDGLGHLTTWHFNQYGWPTSKSNTLGITILTNGYDADGRVTSRWMMGTNTTYSYDAVGNLTSVTYPATNIVYKYDAIHELTNMTDISGTTMFTWTSTGLLASETAPWASSTVSFGYTQGHRTILTLTEPTNTWSQTYNYDGAWRLSNLTSPAGSFGYSYPSGNDQYLVGGIALPNGASIANSYDTLGRLTSTSLADHWGHILDGYAYGIDLLGLRTNIIRQLGLSTNNIAIGYDPISEITNWSGREMGGALRQNEQLSYSYDAAGNLRIRTNNALVQTFAVNSLNELSNVTRTGTFTLSGSLPAPPASVYVNTVAAQTNGDFTFAGTGNTITNNGTNVFTIVAENLYGANTTNILSVNLPATVAFQSDPNGNLTNDGTRVFQYDAENQLTNIYATNAWRVSFVYDGLNRKRVEIDYTWSGTWVPTNGIQFIYDGDSVIQERTTNNAVTVTYTRGLDFSGSRQGAGGIGGLLARTDVNGSLFYHADGNGNITALMDGNQRVTARYEYDPYGRLLGMWGTNAPINRYRFSSKEFISAAGLYGFGYRYYEPNFSRWLNRDPIQEQGGINLYGFVGNNPVNLVDAFGLQYDPNSLNALTGPPQSSAGVTDSQAITMLVAPPVILAATATGVGLAVDAYAIPVLASLGVGAAAAETPQGQQVISEAENLLPVVEKEAAPAIQKAEDAAVAGGRAAYESLVKNLSCKAAQLKQAGKTPEQIARALSADRRAIGEQFKSLTPPDLLKQITERNITKYGDPLGPSVDWLREQGKTWEQIIESAQRPGGQDLGF